MSFAIIFVSWLAKRKFVWENFSRDSRVFLKSFFSIFFDFAIAKSKLSGRATRWYWRPTTVTTVVGRLMVQKNCCEKFDGITWLAWPAFKLNASCLKRPKVKLTSQLSSKQKVESHFYLHWNLCARLLSQTFPLIIINWQGKCAVKCR